MYAGGDGNVVGVGPCVDDVVGVGPCVGDGRCVGDVVTPTGPDVGGKSGSSPFGTLIVAPVGKQ